MCRERFERGSIAPKNSSHRPLEGAVINGVVGGFDHYLPTHHGEPDIRSRFHVDRRRYITRNQNPEAPTNPFHLTPNGHLPSIMCMLLSVNRLGRSVVTAHDEHPTISW